MTDPSALRERGRETKGVPDPESRGGVQGENSVDHGLWDAQPGQRGPNGVMANTVEGLRPVQKKHMQGLLVVIFFL